MVLLGWTEPPQSAEHIREHVPRASVCPSSLSGQAARPSRSQGPITARPLCLHFVFLFWSVFSKSSKTSKPAGRHRAALSSGTPREVRAMAGCSRDTEGLGEGVRMSRPTRRDTQE